MSIWTVTAKRADFNAIASHFGIDPVVARVIRNRDVESIEEIERFLYGQDEAIRDPMLLKDCDKAAKILWEQISAKKHIRIVGDYDVDGVTSTCILFKGLKAMGAIVDYRLPHRVTDGYGINEAIVEEAIEEGVQCILTCDNGISAKSVLEEAKFKGLTCIVTDHHEIPYIDENGVRIYIYPEVDAIVNPKRHDGNYPFPGICGAFVAYKLINMMLTSRSAYTNDASAELSGTNEQALVKELRALAALGTVCDVCELKDENRALVRLGLRDMEDSGNIGLQALLRVNKLEGKSLTTYSCGFVIGPCINSTGRLDDATMSLELLTSDDMNEALVRANELKRLNDMRKEMTEKGVEAAISQVEESNLLKDRVLVIYLPELHESLAGIVAGRIKERYYRPTFVLTSGEEGLKGSGRSIEGYHMYEEMNKISDIFLKFGGHAMAAGFSIATEQLSELRNRLNELCQLTDNDLQPKIKIDVPMPISYVRKELIEQLSLLEPYGVGNPKPVFAQKDVRIISARIMGANRNVLKLTLLPPEGGRYEGIVFGKSEELTEHIVAKYGQDAMDSLLGGGCKTDTVCTIDIIYYPDINTFQGRETIQFVINDYK